MKELHFTYNMQIDYSVTVSNCNYTIKCIPADTKRQKVQNIKISMYPETEYQWGVDGLSNIQIWGKNTEPHTSFVFRIEGDACTGLSDYEEDADNDKSIIFSCSHGLNKAGENIKSFYRNNIFDTSACMDYRVTEIMQLLFRNFRYESGSTNVNTTAEEAFVQGCGVCQDYAHILISLLQLAGITARYVTGFIIGEGESHAWVEYLNDGRWYGIDPTHNRRVNDDYIKIGHGRDAKDCLINRGIMHGGGLHTQTVKVCVYEARKG